MCNLYRMNRSAAEVARLFRAAPGNTGLNAAHEVYPGYPAIVVAGAQVQAMVWGFPLALTGKHGQPIKPKHVNNTRADKLASPFWRASFERRRCLVPVTSFAEAEGSRGHKTRTWLSVAGHELFAFAGIWRDTDEWGQCFSIVTTEASPAMAPVHDRMPVIIAEGDWEQWQHGPPDDAQVLCLPWQGLLAIDRTEEPWGGW